MGELILKRLFMAMVVFGTSGLLVATLNEVAMGHGFSGVTPREFWQLVLAICTFMMGLGFVTRDYVKD